MVEVSEKCIAENPGTNLTSVYTLGIQLDQLNEPTKCYIDCILVSIGTVSEIHKIIKI